MKEKKNRAIVLGASVAGLLAGRVLADFFDEVLLLDKETLEEGPNPRKAVPQGNHIHVILTPTFRVLRRFLPEVIDDLADNGAHIFDGGREWHLNVFGNYLANGLTGQSLIGSSRPLFEDLLRRRVNAHSKIETRTGLRFTGWLTDSERRLITGVGLQNGDEQIELDADIVIDARGLSSTLPKELEDLGYKAPNEELVGVDLGYTTRLYRAPDFSPDWNLLIANPSPPRTWRGGLIEKIEGGKWIVTQFGYFGDHAPADEDGFFESARTLDVPDIAEFIKSANPASEFRRYGTRECRMRRFEKLSAFPDRLLVIGDAVCGLNPVYGQGMTKAAREAEYLHDSLSSQLAKNESLVGFCDRFRRGLPNAGAEWAWQLTTGNDLGYPQTIGKRQFLVGRFMGWYMKRLFQRSAVNLDARKQLFDVLMLVKSPANLMKPAMIRHAIGF